MKRLVGLTVAVIMLVLLVAAFSGCGTTTKESGAKDIVVPQGKISISKSGNEVAVTKDGTTETWTASELGEKALGFPVPADAKLVKGTAIQISGAQDEKWAGAMFYSTDTVEGVINFYRSQLSSMEGFSDTSTNVGGQAVGLFSTKSGNTVKSVIIKPSGSGEQGKTTIQIATSSNAGS